MATNIKKLIQSANAGCPGCQFLLASKYEEGKDGLPQDYQKAVYYYTKSAEQGYLNAIDALAYLNFKGEHIEQDVDTAIALWSKAADRGDFEALNNLASIYFQGDHVEKDTDKAIALWSEAADEGNPEAVYSLANAFYSMGDYKSSAISFCQYIDILQGHYKEEE